MSDLAARYMKAMASGQIDACIRIEQDAGLYGYPPELVTVGLTAIDQGKDGFLAVDEYIAQEPLP